MDSAPACEMRQITWVCLVPLKKLAFRGDLLKLKLSVTTP